jgi:ferredoxin
VTSAERLVVDPIACHAHGLCAEMLPDLVRLDEWGYPLLSTEPIPRRRRREVRAAARACPTLALRLHVAHVSSSAPPDTI